MTLPIVRLVDADSAAFEAALVGDDQLSAVLGVRVSPGWEGFPEALPSLLRAAESRRPGEPHWGSVLFLVDSDDEGVLVGLGGYHGAPDNDGVVEIGYSVAPEFRRRGVATAAVEQLVARAFADATVTAVIAHTLEGPNPSTGVLDRAGFARAGDQIDPDEGTVWTWRRERAPG